MATLKKLASETVLYGVSSILGRFINWLMVPLYTHVFQEPNYPKSEYGIQTELMAYVAVFIVLLTYGMETGFFRFASDNKYDKNKVFATSQTALAVSSLLFIGLFLVFLSPLSAAFAVADRSFILVLLAITLAGDAYSSIPFAKLRLDNRPIRFAIIKLLNIAVNVLSNLFFFMFCPYWLAEHPDSWVQHLYQHDIGIGYVFISYLLATLFSLLLLLPTLKGVRFSIDKLLLRKMLRYTLPIMFVGLASMLNINFDKIAMKYLLVGDDVLAKLAEYGAAFKLGVLMTLFTQAYRYAFEPFIFSSKTEDNAKLLYADALKFFTIIGLLGFLGVMFYLDIIGLLIGESFRAAFVIIPYILLANLFLGMYYSLSLWYKLTDNTKYGAYMALGGAVVTILLNVLLVPRFGYIGAAYAFCTSSFLMFVVSYCWGQKQYPIPYQLKRILSYFFIALALYFLSLFVSELDVLSKLCCKTFLLIVFVVVVCVREPKLYRFLPKRS